MDDRASQPSVDELGRKLDDLTRAAREIHRDVDEIKLRLFNGVTEIIRETYSKVLLLEKNQQSKESQFMELQRIWVKYFRWHDHKMRSTMKVFVVALFLIISAWVMVVGAEGNFLGSLVRSLSA